MRFLHSTRYSRNLEKSFCYRFFRWILWFSVSLYFLSSFLVTRNKPTTSVSRTIVSPSKKYHSVIEETSHNSSATKISSGLFKGLKVYVYDLPSKYNTDWLSNERCSSHLFASEVAIHRALISGDVRTLDPWEADFFFVPVYVSCNFSTVNGFPAIGHARSLISSAIKHVSSQLPFWNRSLGSDHGSQKRYRNGRSGRSETGTRLTLTEFHAFTVAVVERRDGHRDRRFIVVERYWNGFWLKSETDCL